MQTIIIQISMLCSLIPRTLIIFISQHTDIIVISGKSTNGLFITILQYETKKNRSRKKPININTATSSNDKLELKYDI